MTKRTCGECEHLKGIWRYYCDQPLPIWAADMTIHYDVAPDTDATHCETFTPKRKDDE